MTKRKSIDQKIPEIVARFCLVRKGNALVLELVQDFTGGCTRERYRQIVAKLKRQYGKLRIMRKALKEIKDSQEPWEIQRLIAIEALMDLKGIE